MVRPQRTAVVANAAPHPHAQRIMLVPQLSRLGAIVRVDDAWGVVVEASDPHPRYVGVLAKDGRVRDVCKENLRSAFGHGAMPAALRHLWYSRSYKRVCGLLSASGAGIPRDVLVSNCEVLKHVIDLPLRLLQVDPDARRPRLAAFIAGEVTAAEVRLPHFGALLEDLREEAAAERIQGIIRGWLVRMANPRRQRVVKLRSQPDFMRALTLRVCASLLLPDGAPQPDARVSPVRERPRLWFWDAVPGGDPALRADLNKIKEILTLAFRGNGLGSARERKTRDRLMRQRSRLVQRQSTRRALNSSTGGYAGDLTSLGCTVKSCGDSDTASPQAARTLSPSAGLPKRHASSLALALRTYVDPPALEQQRSVESVRRRSSNLVWTPHSRSVGPSPPPQRTPTHTGIAMAPDGTRFLTPDFEIPAAAVVEEEASPRSAPPDADDEPPQELAERVLSKLMREKSSKSFHLKLRLGLLNSRADGPTPLQSPEQLPLLSTPLTSIPEVASMPQSPNTAAGSPMRPQSPKGREDMTLEEFVMDLRARSVRGGPAPRCTADFVFPLDNYVAAWEGEPLELEYASPRRSSSSKRRRAPVRAHRTDSDLTHARSHSGSPPVAVGITTGRVASGHRTTNALHNQMRAFDPRRGQRRGKGYGGRGGAESSSESDGDPDDPSGFFLEFEEELLHAAALGFVPDFTQMAFNPTAVAAWPTTDRVGSQHTRQARGTLRFRAAPKAPEPHIVAQKMRLDPAVMHAPPVMVHRF